MATGVYNHINFHKFRVMHCLWKHKAITGCAEAMTNREISEFTGIPAGNISRMMTHYRKIKAHYFRRIKPEKGDNAYRYRLTTVGVKYLMKYMQRFVLGLSLNCKTRKLKHMPHFTEMRIVKIGAQELNSDLNPVVMKYYMGVTRQGSEELGIKPQDVINTIKNI
jgi:hypothetical protein